MFIFVSTAPRKFVASITNNTSYPARRSWRRKENGSCQGTRLAQPGRTQLRAHTRPGRWAAASGHTGREKAAGEGVFPGHTTSAKLFLIAGHTHHRGPGFVSKTARGHVAFEGEQEGRTRGQQGPVLSPQSPGQMARVPAPLVLTSHLPRATHPPQLTFKGFR